jgi:hypothetical protein
MGHHDYPGSSKRRFRFGRSFVKLSRLVKLMPMLRIRRKNKHFKSGSRHREKPTSLKKQEESWGTYYLKTNQAGPGSHVCNCGYMVASSARGRGLATAMCEHSQKIARALGCKAMQFNTELSGVIGVTHAMEK